MAGSRHERRRRRARAGISILLGLAVLGLLPSAAPAGPLGPTKIRVVEKGLPKGVSGTFDFTLCHNLGKPDCSKGLSTFKLATTGRATKPTKKTIEVDTPDRARVQQIIAPDQLGWTLNGIICTAPGLSSDDVMENTGSSTDADGDVRTWVIVKAPAGKTTTCRFVNLRKTALTVVKDAVPDDPQNFSILFGDCRRDTIADAVADDCWKQGDGIKSVDDDPRDPKLAATLQVVPFTGFYELPGVYILEEGIPPAASEWSLGAIECSGVQDSLVDLANSRVYVKIGWGDNAVCTFRNSRPLTSQVPPGSPTAPPSSVPSAPGDPVPVSGSTTSTTRCTGPRCG